MAELNRAPFYKIGLNLESGINLNFFANQTYKSDATTDTIGIYSSGDVIPLGEDILNDSPNDWDGNNIASFYISPQLTWDISQSVQIYGGLSWILGLGDLADSEGPQPLEIDENDVLSSLTKSAEKTTLRAWFIEIGLRFRFNGLKGNSKN